jgi:molecular chaperone DnaJ
MHRGSDIKVAIEVKLSEAILGAKKNVEFSFMDVCPECDAVGATEFNSCADCAGAGFLYSQQGHAQMMSICSSCGGKGNVALNSCKTCKGKRTVATTRMLNVTIPAGIKHGQKMALNGQGQKGRNGGPPGDVFLILQVSYPTNLTKEQEDYLRKLDE